MCDTSFIVDSMGGKIAKWLRILGCDTLYARPSLSDSSLLDIAKNRVLVTRDKELGYRVRKSGGNALLIPEDVVEALALISEELSINLKIDPRATRCPFCNTKLLLVKRSVVAGKIPKEVANAHTKFLICPSCGKMFWFGTHYWNMLMTLAKIKEKKYHISNSRADDDRRRQ